MYLCDRESCIITHSLYVIVKQNVPNFLKWFYTQSPHFLSRKQRALNTIYTNIIYNIIYTKIN